jgi:hypothetical protein
MAINSAKTFPYGRLSTPGSRAFWRSSIRFTEPTEGFENLFDVRFPVLTQPFLPYFYGSGGFLKRKFSKADANPHSQERHCHSLHNISYECYIPKVRQSLRLSRVHHARESLGATSRSVHSPMELR